MTMLSASLTTLALYYSAAVPLTPEALGAAWSGTISSVLMIWLRYVTASPIQTTRDPMPKKEEAPE